MVMGDAVIEPDEDFTVTLSNPSMGAVIAITAANGTILNDDGGPSSLSIAATDAVKAEGNAGATSFTFTVTRSNNPAGTATVDFAVSGAEVNGADFVGGVLPTGTVTFADGVTTQTITIMVMGDMTVELNENFTVTLSNPSAGAVIATPAANGTILNDDGSNVGLSISAVGGGPGEDIVNIFNSLTGALLATITPYPGFFGGIRTAVADVNGDGVLDVITGTGSGGGPHIKVFSGADNFVTELFSFFAFNDPNFSGGVYVAAANFNPGTGTGQDGVADIVVSADAGGGSRVTVYNGTPVPLGSVPSVRQDFFAYGAAFFGGVRVGTGDINGDGIPDIITGAGDGGGPHVRVFDGSLMQITPTPTDIGGPLGSFFAFDPNFAGGAFVSSGDINGDGRDDIIVGAGAGGGPRVSVFATTLPNYGDVNNQRIIILDFFAFPSNFAGGVTVGSTEGPDADSIDDIIVGAGPGGGPAVGIYHGDFSGGTPGVAVQDASFFGMDPTFVGGVFVSGGVIDASSSGTLSSNAAILDDLFSNGDLLDALS